jgi:hypothetical protein
LLIAPQRSRLATGSPRRLWDTTIQRGLDTYLGKAFEGIVHEAYARYHERWELPAAVTWTRWEGTDRLRESVEIDVAGRLEDGRLLAGEIKWSSSPLGPGRHTALQNKLARLAVSGQGWARDTDDAHFLYVSAAGFTPEMQALAAADPRVRCLRLEDLYME